MHLKSLTLRGFKSFASATTLKFEPGICAVVGPNGSGKSNVVDALAWVMGEQGVKTLRGGKMQDVIFAGAGDRKALGRAEVTLTIDNHDGKLPIDFAEVSITRRMYRDGASEYEINGSRARLMDVQELLSDSGIGREMHIIVGQGKLAEILDSRPDDRRAYIEEAAGVLKHRRRREKAQRKLQGMQTNLDRLTDLKDELAKQLKPLSRQAAAAKRARTVQATLRQARLELAAAQILELRDASQALASRAEIAVAKAETISEKLEELESKQVIAEKAVSELNPQLEAAQNLWFELSTLAERVSATHRIATERAVNAATVTIYNGPDPADLEARANAAEKEYEKLAVELEIAAAELESLAEEKEDREEALRAAEAEHRAALRAIADKREGMVRLLAQQEAAAAQYRATIAECQRLTEGLEDSQKRLHLATTQATEVAAQLSELEAEYDPLVAANKQAEKESTALKSRLNELVAAQKQREQIVYSLTARIEALKANAPKLSALEVLPDKLPLLAAYLHPEPQARVAVAAILGSFGDALVLPANSEISLSLKELAAALEKAERTAVIIADSTTAETSSAQIWNLEITLPSQAQWLLSAVKVAREVAKPISRLLADVVLVADMATAEKVIALDSRLRVVTEAGVILGEGWFEAGHSRARIVDIQAQINEAEVELEAAQQSLEELSGTVTGANQAADDARLQAAHTAAALKDYEVQRESWKRELERANNTAAGAAKEAERAQVYLTNATERAELEAAQLADLEQRVAALEGNQVTQSHEPSTAGKDAAYRAVEEIRAMELKMRLNLRTMEERAQQLENRAAGLRTQASHEKQAKIRHEKLVAAKKAQQEAATQIAQLAEKIARRVEVAVAQASLQKTEVGAQKTQALAVSNSLQAELSAARNQYKQLNKAAQAAEISATQAKVRQEEAENQALEQFSLSLEELVEKYAPGPDFDKEATQKNLTQAEKDLSSLGKVNPLALEEFAALEERYNFLATQLADVEQARADLHQVIETVDQQILQLFTDAWHDVEAEFPKVFGTLFPGGSGRLYLTDPTDMLGTGIELEARPPGKKVKRLSLLSGGEKSLTALALLVSIFRARPSPFYVMDEVEAALDDVNLRRLINLFEVLRADSQLIVITHQKPTMDVANVLYGVTMRSDGISRVLSQRMQPVADKTLA
ncbi:chromosome segregation protein SMC [Corynebacterium caspium]|uniref:chromosome segregation protein SMC n=1 Tax=Corynebacterium caspium TaxID=234828 RepID=UPI0003724BD5|nr:chromosome segregation protein SMC [Corynebacterium caspium]WKD59048.1 Chromosome partition protein Smc [Corynebacterium caspium DSM 44850]